MPEYSIYSNKSITIPNSINVKNFKNLSQKRSKNEIPRMALSISHKASWHGIEKIIEFAKLTNGILAFDIFGLEANQTYTPNIKFWGFKEFDDYKNYLVKYVNIGIGTLSLYKKGLNEASPLKVREYLALGLPTIIGYEDTAFLNKPIPDWILQLENTEDNLIANKDKVVEFAYRMKDYVIPAEEVAKYIDSTILEKKRLDFFKEVIKKN